VANKSSLENVLKSVLSVGNTEQNFAYAPNVYDNHYNIVVSFMLDMFAIHYPIHIDSFLPFIKTKTLVVTDGHVVLPDDFRNLLGAPSISVNPDGKDCSGEVVIDTKAEFKTANLKSGCKSYPVHVVDKKEWDARTTSTYAFPTHKDPIGMYDGKKIKVCPYDITRVTIMYLKKENIYRYGYIIQPDDTYIYNAATSAETEFEDAAFELLFKGVSSLYAAYSRDSSLIEWNAILSKAGLF
jgi:hypothetical protein